MSVTTISRAQTRQNIGRLTGQMYMGQTFAVTVPSPSQFSSIELPFRKSDQGLGLQAYIVSGAGAGFARTVVSANAVGAPSGSHLYMDRAYPSTPSSNSSFELWRSPIESIHQFIDDAIMEAQTKALIPHVDYGVMMGSRIKGGAFERYPNGNSSAPEGFTLAGTNAVVSKETNRAFVYTGDASTKLTNATSQIATLESDNFRNFPALAGEQITVSMKVYATDATRFRFRVDDGVTQTDSAYHDGNSGWDGDGGKVISVTHTVAASPTKLTVMARIETGAAISVYLGRLADDGDFQFTADLAESYNLGLVVISGIFAEGNTDGVFDVPVPQAHGNQAVWEVDNTSSPPQLRFSTIADNYARSGGRQLKVMGFRYPKLPTADSDQIEVDQTFIVNRVSQLLMDSEGYNDMGRSKRDRFARAADDRLDRMMASVGPDAVTVEVF